MRAQMSRIHKTFHMVILSLLYPKFLKLPENCQDSTTFKIWLLLPQIGRTSSQGAFPMQFGGCQATIAQEPC